MAKSNTKKRKVIVDAIGEAHITASFNNIIISLTNKKMLTFYPIKLSKKHKLLKQKNLNNFKVSLRY